MAVAATTVNLKLLVDKKTRKVVFAEADKSFVDFLFNLISLPLGNVIKLVSPSSMVGSLGNVYDSIQKFSDTYLQPNVKKQVLLNPKVPTQPFNVPLLMIADASGETKKFYVCVNNHRFVSDEPNNICPNCKGRMNNEVNYVAPVKAESSRGDESGGFVKGVVTTYMVTDDLKIMPQSVISTVNVLNEHNIKDLGSLEVKNVNLGVDEGLKLLKAALHTDSAFTTVFLGE